MFTLYELVRSDLGNETAYKIMHSPDGDFYAPDADTLSEFMFENDIDPSRLVVQHFTTETQSGNKAVLVVRVA